METLYGVVYPFARSIYTATGDVVMIAAALAGLVTWWRIRRPLVASGPPVEEEE
jgi:uncharacterized iron-regulated membrane protein